MKIRRSEILLTLLVCAVTLPLFSQTSRSSLKDMAATATKPFVKMVQGTGPLIQTIQDAKGGYVSVSKLGIGQSGHAFQSFLIRRIRSSGEPIWERELDFQSAPSSLDRFSLEAIAQTTDDGYIVVGSFSHCKGFYCFYYAYETSISAIAVKLGSNGVLQWKKSFSVSSNFVEFTSVASMPDGGFLATGVSTTATHSAVLMVRFTSSGNILWTKGFESLDADFQLLPTPDNGFILATGIRNGAEVIKLDNLANVVWGKSFEIPGFILQTVKVSSDGGIVLAGTCRNCHQLSLIRLETDGKISWTAKYALQVFNGPGISDFIQTPDGGYAVTGTIVPGSGKKVNPFLLKLDPSLNVVFQETFRTGKLNGGPVFATGGSGYLIFRSSGEDTLVSKVNPQGTVPGCGSFYSVPTDTISFGELKTSQLKVKKPISLSLGTNDIAATSVTSSHSVTTVCQ
jgi:hypothetical protein